MGLQEPESYETFTIICKLSIANKKSDDFEIDSTKLSNEKSGWGFPGFVSLKELFDKGSTLIGKNNCLIFDAQVSLIFPPRFQCTKASISIYITDYIEENSKTGS